MTLRLRNKKGSALEAVGNGVAPSGLWAFMLSVYRRPGVADACLRLQDTHGLDVPLMLAVLHGGLSGRILDPERISSLEADCRSWREIAIRPLREARRAMKSHDWLASHPRAVALRESVKAAELNAERVQAEALERMLRGMPADDGVRDAASLTELLAMVLDLYDRGRAERSPVEAMTIVEAALRTASSPNL